MRRTNLLRLSLVTFAALSAILVPADLHACCVWRLTVMEVVVTRGRDGEIALQQQELDQHSYVTCVFSAWHDLLEPFEGETFKVAGMSFANCCGEVVNQVFPQAILFSPDQLDRAVRALKRTVQPKPRGFFRSLRTGAIGSWFGLFRRTATSAYTVSMTKHDDCTWAFSDLSATDPGSWSIGCKGPRHEALLLSCESAWRDLLWAPLVEADPWDNRPMPASIHEAAAAARAERGALYDAIHREVSQLTHDLVPPTTPAAVERAQTRLVELIDASN